MTPSKGFDLRHYQSPLSEEEKRQAREEGLRQKALQALGARYLCHSSNAPKRGTYNPITGVRMA